MLHLGTMTKHEMPKGSARGSNAPQPVRTLRDWLDHLAARDRLAVIKPNANLRFEVAAYAKRLDGQRATMFPKPGGHPMPVVSGLISDRGWMAEAMGVEPAEVVTRFQEASLNPIPWQETKSAPGAGGGASRGRSGAAVAAADPQRARRRAVHQRRPDDRAQSEDRKAERLDPPLPAHRAEPARRAAAAAPHPRVLRYGRAERPAARRRDRRRRRSADAARLAGDRAARLRRAGDRRRAAGQAAAGGEMRHQRDPRAGRGRSGDRRPLPAEGARDGRAVRRVPAIL